MDRKTKIKVFISCLCFLGVIYGLASLDQGHRKQGFHDVTAMAEDTPVLNLTQPQAEKKIMYLTFDDGPSKHTQEVLDLLNKYHIKATFFVTGENPEQADLLKTIHEQGHAIGIHTYSHEYSKIYSSVDAYFQDVEKVSNLIKEKTGVESHILRFPGGSSNTVSRNYQDGIMSQLAQEAQKRGYVYYDWNGENGDGDPSISADALYQEALHSIEGKQEVMMLMHDGSANANTVSSLDQTLAELVQQGWEFKIIEDSAQMPVFHHTIAN